MKKFKPLLPLGHSTALERCVSLFQCAGIHDVRVIVGHRADALIPMLDQWGVRWVINHGFEAGMISSVKTGVADLESSKRAFFLLPVDVPLVRRTTVQDLLDAHKTQSADVWYPTFLGKRGHPPLISMKYRPALLAWQGEGGLRAFLHEREPQAIDVKVADEHILVDMDSPEQYEAALARLDDCDIPSVCECTVLLTEKFRVERHILAHSIKVAQVATQLARKLNKADCNLNVKLIVAAALLHDAAKGRPNHAAEAARSLTELGYETVAQVVGAHMDTQPLLGEPISAAEVVCFADKMVQADRIVPVEKRFGNRLGICGEDSRMAAIVSQRLFNVLSIKERLEAALGSSVESVLSSVLSNGGEAWDGDLSLEAR
jgi:CTP:molybdopterin cytidylyltransferase MocA